MVSDEGNSEDTNKPASSVIPRLIIPMLFCSFSIWYVFEWINFFRTKNHPFFDGTFFGIYLLFFILWFWCYLKTSWVDPGFLETFFKTNNISDFSNLPKCPKCGLPKPPRCHHCSKCNRCVLFFDHHCPCTGNCIGLNNYKAFTLMNIYGGTAAIFSLIEAFLYQSIAFAMVGLIGGASWFIFGFSYLCGACSNTTTTERMHLDCPEICEKLNFQNYQQIFGSHWYEKIFPIKTKLTGFEWIDSNESYLINEDSESP